MLRKIVIIVPIFVVATNAFAFKPPFIKAAQEGNRKEVFMWLELGEDVNQSWDSFAWTALHLAAFQPNPEMVGDLLAAGANPYARLHEEHPTQPRFVLDVLAEAGHHSDLNTAAGRPQTQVFYKPRNRTPFELSLYHFVHFILDPYWNIAAEYRALWVNEADVQSARQRAKEHVKSLYARVVHQLLKAMHPGQRPTNIIDYAILMMENQFGQYRAVLRHEPRHNTDDEIENAFLEVANMVLDEFRLEEAARLEESAHMFDFNFGPGGLFQVNSVTHSGANNNNL